MDARLCRDSGRQRGAALGAAAVDGRTTRAGTHTHTETMLHMAATVVRLERPLHDGNLPVSAMSGHGSS